ncbi:unnamed protein product [Trichogramma brassicae]|uniref:Replication factor C subunit 3 n=1 Tax=Trichogramma brassicae TaxID=86971 RepID=A0A6H5J1L3_9HYME|nr:unnamed protein product [Trichogramma brassicae]
MKCIPDKIFTYDHNVCYCNENGTEVTCKRKMFTTLTPELHRIQFQNITVKCEPNEPFKDICRDCICHESGNYASCLRRKCPTAEAKLETRDKCTPGSVFSDRCNGCICGSNGTAVCTKLDCRQFSTNTNMTITCDPTTIFQYNCHHCHCGETGKFAMCSGIACPHEHDMTRAAAYEITEKNPKFGAMVAQAQSSSERSKRAPVEALCPINNNYMEDCNQCYCDPTNGHTSCSRNPCPPKAPTTTTTEPPSVVSDTCPSGTRYKLDCNECTCELELGVTHCTMNSCPQPEFSGEGSDVKYRRGKETIDGSSRTRIDEGIRERRISFSSNIRQLSYRTKSRRNATEKNCNNSGSTFIPAGACPRGTTYQEDCNTCNCNAVSGLTSCTRYPCDVVSNSVVSTTTTTERQQLPFFTPAPFVPTPPPGERTKIPIVARRRDGFCARTYFSFFFSVANNYDCPRGREYKDDCNTCTCDPATGVVCTRFACAPQTVTVGPNYTCPKGSAWEEDCNVCFCDAINGPKCTKNKCAPPIPTNPSTYETRATRSREKICIIIRFLIFQLERLTRVQGVRSTTRTATSATATRSTDRSAPKTNAPRQSRSTQVRTRQYATRSREKICIIIRFLIFQLERLTRVQRVRSTTRAATSALAIPYTDRSACRTSLIFARKETFIGSIATTVIVSTMEKYSARRNLALPKKTKTGFQRCHQRRRHRRSTIRPRRRSTLRSRRLAGPARTTTRDAGSATVARTASATTATTKVARARRRGRTNSTSRVLPAIRSRCLGIRVPAPTIEEIKTILTKVAKKEGHDLPDELAERIATTSERNLRRALLMLETCRVEQIPYTPDQKVTEPDWQLYIKGIAALMVKEQSPSKLLELRSRFYELLTHRIPSDLIFKGMLQEINKKCDLQLKIQVANLAAEYEHRMHQGSKEIFHLEAFAAKFMSLYKKFMDASMADFM